MIQRHNHGSLLCCVFFVMACLVWLQASLDASVSRAQDGQVPIDASEIQAGPERSTASRRCGTIGALGGLIC